jgi:hypothetical protein
MRGIDVLYQLCYFLSSNARNAYIILQFSVRRVRPRDVT